MKVCQQSILIKHAYWPIHVIACQIGCHAFENYYLKTSGGEYHKDLLGGLIGCVDGLIEYGILFNKKKGNWNQPNILSQV